MAVGEVGWHQRDVADGPLRTVSGVFETVGASQTAPVCFQDWGDVEDGYRDHPGSRSRRSGEELIEWTPIKAHEIK